MTRTDCLDMIAKYIDAERLVLLGKEVAFGGSGPISRRFTHEDIAEIRKGRQEWERRLAAIDAADSGRSSCYSLAEFG